MFKKIISYLLTFLLICILLAVSCIMIAQNTVLEKQYILGILEKTNYYEKMEKNINEAFQNYILQSGLEEDVINNLFEKEKLHADILNVMDCIYENKGLEVETETIRTKLQKRIDEVLEQNNKKLDKEGQIAIEKFITAITEAYSSEVVYSSTVITKVGNILNNQIKPLLFIGLVTLIATLVILLLILLIINRSEFLHYFGILLFANGMLLMILPVGIRMGVKIKSLLLLNASFSETLITIIQSILNTTLMTGVIMTVIGLSFMILCSIIEKRNELAE